MRVVFTKSARQDLRAIALRIAERNPKRALTYIGELEGYCKDITPFPDAGTPRPQWGVGVLTRYFGRYIIVFRSRDGAVQILRIVHGARKLDTLFEDEPLPE